MKGRAALVLGRRVHLPVPAKQGTAVAVSHTAVVQTADRRFAQSEWGPMSRSRPKNPRRLMQTVLSARFHRRLRYRIRTKLQPLERRVYIGFGASGVGLGVVTAVAYSSHAKWANAWIPNFISGWSGIFVAVAVINRLQALDRERKAVEDRAQVNLIAAHGLASCVEPVAYYVGALIGSGDAGGISQRATTPLTSPTWLPR